jgi:hypothetical protein
MYGKGFDIRTRQSNRIRILLLKRTVTLQVLEIAQLLM